MTERIAIDVFDSGPIDDGALDGPCPDPCLIIFDQELRRLSREYGDGFRLRRFWLGWDPKSYIKFPEVAALLRERGPAVLPITMVDGRVVQTGAYPGLGEIEPQPVEEFNYLYFQ